MYNVLTCTLELFAMLCQMVPEAFLFSGNAKAESQALRTIIC